MEYKNIKPFIKWAGGKGQLLNEIRKKYPQGITSYCEPFIGGGAVLLDILANFKPVKVMINDINPELINSYIQIRDNVDELISQLQNVKSEFLNLKEDERNIYYYNKRNIYNELIQSDNADLTKKAVLFIFLNKTCFNGLYRVNKSGLFNVPMGSYKMPTIFDEKEIIKINRLLQGVIINCGNYTECFDFIDKNTFVYIDPPYRPINQTSSFTAYNENTFGDAEQIDLENFINRISSKGAKVVASNSDPKNVNENDNFFDDLYKAYKIARVSAKRNINSNGNSRGSISELLISNF